MVEINLY